MGKSARKKAFASLKKKTKILISAVIAVIVVAGIGSLVFSQTSREQKNQPQVLSVSTLEKIIKVSELSTFTAVYNGIAEVHHGEDPEQVDYYVSYNAQVNAGIDFEKISPAINEEEKTITIDIPSVYITDINVDISSMDFIFYNDSLNTSSITEEAFKACEVDVQAESEKQEEILNLAQQNAVNVVTALVDPLIQQADLDYTLIVE